jgi:hypothetical protein
MRTFYLLLVIGAYSGAFAQKMDQSVVAAAGDYSKNLQEGSSIIWTLGELSTEYFDNGITLQQGFHQTELELIVSSIQVLIPASDWDIFPNPADFHLHLSTQFESTWHYELHDLLGRIILQGETNQKTLRINLPRIDAGIYLIRIRNGKGLSTSRKIFIQQN